MAAVGIGSQNAMLLFDFMDPPSEMEDQDPLPSKTLEEEKQRIFQQVRDLEEQETYLEKDYSQTLQSQTSCEERLIALIRQGRRLSKYRFEKEGKSHPPDFPAARKHLEEALGLLEGSSILNARWIQAGIFKYLAFTYCREIDFLRDKNKQKEAKEYCKQSREIYKSAKAAQENSPEQIPDVQWEGNLQDAPSDYDKILQSSLVLQNGPLRILLGEVKICSDFISHQTKLESALALLSKMSKKSLEASWVEAVIFKYLAYIFLQEEASSREENQKRVEEAQKAARECYQRGWEVSNAHRTLAVDYVQFLRNCFQDRLEAHQADARKDPDLKLALEICDKAMHEHSSCPDFHYHKAQISRSREEWKKVNHATELFFRLKNIRAISIKEEYQRQMLDLSIEACIKTSQIAEAILQMKEAWESETNPPDSIRRSREILTMQGKASVPKDSKMLQAALDLAKSKEPEKAFELFNLIRECYGNALLFCEEFQILRGRIEAHLGKKELEPAEKLLQEASAFVDEWKSHFGDDSERRRAQLHCCSARLAMKKGNGGAQRHFELGWKLNPDWEFALEYIEFCTSQNLYKKALEICQQAEGKALRENAIPSVLIIPHSSYLQAHLFYALGRWAEAKASCNAFFNATRGNRDLQRREMIDLAIQICNEEGSNPLPYLKMAFWEGRSSQLISLSQELLKKDLETPPEDYLDYMIQTATSILDENPDEALELAQYISDQPLTPEQNFKTILLEAKIQMRCANFIIARLKLNEAWSLLPEDFPTGSLAAFEKANLLYFYALLALKEYKSDRDKKNHLREVEDLFQQGFDLCNSHRALVFEYIEFLMKQGKNEEALKVWSKSALKWEDTLFLEVKISLPLGNLHRAQEACNEFLRICPFIQLQLELLDLMIPACTQAQDYSNAYGYAKRAYQSDPSPSHFKERFNTYVSASKNLITDKHLGKTLMEPLEKEKFSSNPQKIISYITALLQEYKEELGSIEVVGDRHEIHLGSHTKHFLNWLCLRGQLRAQIGQWDLAKQDYESVKRVLAYKQAPEPELSSIIDRYIDEAQKKAPPKVHTLLIK